ncbi:MAG: hypothetical protein A2293_12775 [Elusimicrobia bacterium RIFOXYB2_FULL_49_7]|nr:MAG: hypothetical protein A2293_12775 [Elusimicrobia bacterium RIFOXYB2_FULL_49_7]
MNRFLRLSIGISLLGLLSGCAHQGAPGGGPEDKTPPTIEWVFPSQDSLNVPKKITIQIRLSEWIDPRNAEKAVLISPATPRMETSVSKRTVEITPTGALLDSTTYVITLTTDLTDFRGNKLASSYTLRFSTGAHLDSCALSGRVTDPTGAPLQGQLVGAYPCNDTLTPDPAHIRPLYATLTGTEGRFNLIGLRKGGYRLFAFSDVNQNRKFNADHEQLGLPSEDYRLESGKMSVKNIVLVPAKIDTLPLFIRKAVAGAGSALKVYFSGNLNPDCRNDLIHRILVVSEDTTHTTKDTATITSLWPDPADSTAFLLRLSGLKHGQRYRVEALRCFTPDSIGLDTLRFKLPFLANAGRDSIAPEVTATLPQSDGTLPDNTDSLRLFFSEPIRTPALQEGFSFFRLAPTIKKDSLKSTGKDTLRIAVSGKFAFPSRLEMVFRPDTLQPDAWYEWTLQPTKLIDDNGNYSPDSSLSGRFRTQKPLPTGTLSGRLCVTDPSECRVALHPLIGRNGLDTRPDSSGRFFIPALPEGNYRILFFRDINENGRPDKGRYRPFRFAEPIQIVTDSIHVRERWETEEVNHGCDKTDGNGK